MKRATAFLAPVCAGLLLSFPASAQNLPRIVQLPTSDRFTFAWPEDASLEDRNRPDFDIAGAEVPFECKLTGAFRPGSDMLDFYNLRDFEQSLSTAIEFVQVATSTLNSLWLSRDLDWAIMQCARHESNESEDEIQERIDKAVERAERQREKRREREARKND